MTEYVHDDIAIGIAIEGHIHDTCIVKTQTCVARESSAAEINAVFDKILNAIDRQKKRYQLEDLKLKLEKEKENLDRWHADYEKYEREVYAEYSSTSRARRNGEGMPEDEELWTGQYKINRDNKLVNIKGSRDIIISLEKQIEEYKAIVGG